MVAIQPKPICGWRRRNLRGSGAQTQTTAYHLLAPRNQNHLGFLGIDIRFLLKVEVKKKESLLCNNQVSCLGKNPNASGAAAGNLPIRRQVLISNIEEHFRVGIR